MVQLSASGNELVQRLAHNYGISSDAVTHMLVAVSNGNGTMAQFSHPEFGGSGQWMSGGMTMVSDLFNYQLKNTVNNLCSELSNHLAANQSGNAPSSFQSQSQNGSSSQAQSNGLGGQNALFAPDPEREWWPSNLGSPNAIGSQNNVAYAYFGSARRLAVKTGDSVWVYDTGDHQIGGFSQQQGTGGTITFSSQFGTVNLLSLNVVMKNGMTVQASTPPAPSITVPANSNNPVSNSSSSPSNDFNNNGGDQNQDVFATIERLGQLQQQGLISQEEYAAKKAELLGRI